MLLPIRNKNPRTLRAFGMACLPVGLVLLYFIHPSGRFENIASHFVGGVMLGMSIAFNLCAVRLARRQRSAG
jgi:hypothetical protein